MPESRVNDQALVGRICRAIEAGNTPVTSARAAGISATTFYTWLKRGQEEEEGPYRIFFEKVDRADARSEQTAVALLVEASKSDWKAAESYLSRRFGANWGNKQTQRVEQYTEVSGTVNVQTALETPGFVEAVTQFHTEQLALNPGKPQRGRDGI